MDDLALLRARQHGVTSASQLRAAGWLPHDVKRALRRREVAVVHRGVYVDHTGPPTWEQRAWAAVLVHGPAALTGRSVLRAALGTADAEPVHVAIDARRTVTRVAGVVAHRTAHLDDRVRWSASPPTVRVEHVAIDLAAHRVRAGDVAGAFALLADTWQSRLTTPRRLRESLAGCPALAGRRSLEPLLADLEAGSASVLEREWLRLERVHGLPPALRQARGRGNDVVSYRDALLPGLGVVVELDGRAFHDSARARDRDAARDLAAAVDDLLTVRLTWGQVFREGCLTVERVAALLRVRGWGGCLRRCPRCA